LTVQGFDTTLSAGWGIELLEGQDQGPLLVDEADLVRWLSAQFQTYPGCSGVSVEQVIRLESADSQGCNWSRTLFLDSGGAPPTDYAPAYAAIVEMGRKAFNLKDCASAAVAAPEGDPAER
jgi:hypothetical protein